MVGVSKEVVSLVYYLLPGFLAAWIYYGLTAHPKPSPFERVVQALIFTAIIQALVSGLREILFLFGKVVSIGNWSEEVALPWALVTAFILGHVLAWGANNNWYHDKLFRLNITKKTSSPSQWYKAFADEARFVVLHLKDGRRLYGWPCEWPDQSDIGHFVIMEPEWLLDDNSYVPIDLDEKILIPATAVEMVEFVKWDSESIGKEDRISESHDTLVKLQEETNEQRKQVG